MRDARQCFVFVALLVGGTMLTVPIARSAADTTPRDGYWTGTVTVAPSLTYEDNQHTTGNGGWVTDSTISGTTVLAAANAPGDDTGDLWTQDFGVSPWTSLQSQSYTESHVENDWYGDGTFNCTSHETLTEGPASGSVSMGAFRSGDVNQSVTLDFGATSDDTGTTAQDLSQDQDCPGESWGQRDWLYGPLTWCNDATYGYTVPSSFLHTVDEDRGDGPRTYFVLRGQTSIDCAPFSTSGDGSSFTLSGTVTISVDLTFTAKPIDPDVTAVFGAAWDGNPKADRVKFDASHTSPAGAQFDWNFGDGKTYTTSSPTLWHNYTKPGAYVVTMTATKGTKSDTTSHTVIANPVALYAPLVRLHPNEKYFPMGTSQFVSHSRLRWAHDKGCRDATLVNTGKINQAWLGSHGSKVYVARQASTVLCRPTGKTYAAKQLTRPTDHDSRRPKGLAIDEGFFLDLDNRYRGGHPAVHGVEHAPLSYVYKPGQYVTYFFMYGYNKPATTPLLDNHEGEWERITVRIDSANQATAVWYFQHNCSAEAYSWRQMRSKHYLTAAGHPVVYSANGSHASYPTPVSIALTGGACQAEKPHQGGGDRAAAGGAVWQTWADLVDATHQPWYGFGGAWGEVGNPISNHTPVPVGKVTGPLAPPWKDPGSRGF